MLFYLLTSFADEVSAFNVFQYQTTRTGAAILTALLFVFLFGPRIISLAQGEAGQGPADPHRWTAAPHRGEAGHADHGRTDDPVGHLRIAPLLWADLAQSLCLGRAVRDASASAPSASMTTS